MCSAVFRHLLEWPLIVMRAVFCAMHFTERRLSPWWRAESWWSGIVPAVPTAAGLQRQHVSSPLCSCMLLRKTTLWMPPTVPTAVRDTTSLSMPEPASAPRKDSDTKRLLSFPRGPGSNSTLQGNVRLHAMAELFSTFPVRNGWLGRLKAGTRTVKG